MIDKTVRASHEEEADTAMRQHGRAHDWKYYGGDPFALGTTSCGGIGAG